MTTLFGILPGAGLLLVLDVVIRNGFGYRSEIEPMHVLVGAIFLLLVNQLSAAVPIATAVFISPTTATQTI